ncbi:hypothetical protein BCR43DRAFT_484314 [Syncephalastrum racemosum]|uniref:Uncharacterized protein n=1 Tax=Syncephalastrum racemosum TaxID=13706 RepID=A0A1X2HWM2_SYNRA|nr:hypothetical protein BCR43DRAFT_484314 [Syncephalastrum racemosum]
MIYEPAPPLVLPRFSGSTLEPRTEPVVIYPPHMLQKEPLGCAPNTIQPTRPTESLKRKNKPTFIDIPPRDFVTPSYNEDYSPWSLEEDNSESAGGLAWDDVNQTIYKKPQYNSNSSKHRSPFFSDVPALSN